MNKTKQEIKDNIWLDADLESDGFVSRMEYKEFMVALDKYELALKGETNTIRYEAEVDKLIEEVFRSDWMNELDWQAFQEEFYRNSGETKQSLSEQIEVGIKNGYSIESQIEVAKKLLSLPL